MWTKHSKNDECRRERCTPVFCLVSDKQLPSNFVAEKKMKYKPSLGEQKLEKLTVDLGIISSSLATSKEH